MWGIRGVPTSRSDLQNCSALQSEVPTLVIPT